MKNFWQKFLAWMGIYSDEMILGGVARSPEWPKTKRDFEAIEPKKCAVCGSKKVQLHHLQPFQANPELENDLGNLVWLCEGFLTNHHHLYFGHLGNFQSVNEHLREWIEAIKTRPKWNGREWFYNNYKQK
jgi:hypothetical protein